jgi:hypothetical protein
MVYVGLQNSHTLDECYLNIDSEIKRTLRSI